MGGEERARPAVVSATSLGEFLADTSMQLDDDGVPSDPLVYVCLDGGAIPDGALPRAHRASRDGGRILVGIIADPAERLCSRSLDALTFTLSAGADKGSTGIVAVADLAAARDAIDSMVQHAPRAALVATGVLRIVERLPVCDGLVAESCSYSMLQAGPEFARWRARSGREPRYHDPSSSVLLHREGDVLHVVLTNPERHNAFGRALRDRLVEALEVALADPELSVRISGDGPSFCSGGDLDEFGLVPDPVTAHLVRMETSVARRLHRCRDRVEVFLHGACIGAGIEFSSFAGRVVARSDARIQLPELSMGLIPGAGGMVGLSSRIGRWRTAFLILSGQTIDSRTALAWGLVDAIADLD